ALRRADPLARPGRRQPHGVLVPALSKRRGAAGRVRRSCAPSGNTCRPLARDHTAPEPTLALSKAIQPCCGQVRTLAWCSRPRDSAALPNGALVGEVVPLPVAEPGPEERPVLVLDLGGQYAQLIARRVRECRVYSELVPHSISATEVRRRNPVAMVLSGGPASVYAEDAPRVDPGLFELGVPTLGICYGAQLLALELGGSVERTGVSEFGKTELHVG